MKRWNPPIALYLLLVFISGSVVGALGYRLYSPPSARSNAQQRVNPEEWRKRFMEEMRTRIGLTPDQLQKVNTLMDETKSRFDADRERHHQVVEQIREEQRAKMRAILTPEQLPKYEQYRAERDARDKANKK